MHQARGVRFSAVIVPVALCVGCATGLPVGARSAQLEGLRPFSTPARDIAVPEPDDASLAPLAVPAGSRRRAVALAQELVGKRMILLRGQPYGEDCTGLVRGIYAQLGVDVMAAALPGDNGVTAIWRFADRHGQVFRGGRPVPGDLVFFRETYDLNGDGLANDGLTHVGLVEAVGEDATVSVIHRVSRGVVRYRMNLEHRDSPTSPGGQAVNDWLRTPGPGQKPRLTAQLFAGYATLLPLESRFSSRAPSAAVAKHN
jgi:hypothetical protein